MLQEIVEILENLELTSSRLEKEEILSQSKHLEALKMVIQWVYHPYRKLNIRIKEGIDSLDGPGSSVRIDDVLSLIDSVEQGQSDRSHVLLLLSKASLVEQRWISRILNKDLKVGVGLATIQKVFGKDIVPHFSLQLCSKYDPKKCQWPVA